MKDTSFEFDRRGFLLGAAAAAGLAMPAGAACGSCCAGKGRILFGTTRSKPADVALMKSIGYDFFEQGVAAALGPDKDEEWWKKRRDELLAMPLPLRSCNGFIPGTFRLTGPKADHEPALKYAETAMRRAEEVGVISLVFGSGGARNVPGDFTLDKAQRPDIEEGTRQYTAFCRELCRRTADLKKVAITIEPLRPNESNIINFVWQGLLVCEDVNSPRLMQLADIFHMMMGRESADSIRKAGARLRHCHIAAYGTRSFPGSDPATVERFVPYFQALKDIGYAGGVSCECSFGNKEDLAKNFETALKTMKGLV